MFQPNPIAIKTVDEYSRFEKDFRILNKSLIDGSEDIYIYIYTNAVQQQDLHTYTLYIYIYICLSYSVHVTVHIPLHNNTIQICAISQECVVCCVYIWAGVIGRSIGMPNTFIGAFVLVKDKAASRDNC